MTEFEQFPDAEALAGWLMRTAGITAGRVYSSIPRDPTWPLTTLLRIAGRPAERHHLDRARLQITVWGTSKSEAFDQAQAARVVLLSAAGRTFTTGGGAPVNAYVSEVEDDLGMFWSPDQETARDRYVFGVAFYLHV